MRKMLGIALIVLLLAACGKEKQETLPETTVQQKTEEAGTTAAKESVTAADGPLAFDTTDLNAEKVSMGEVYASHKLTLVNLWASWCGPCVREMPELEKLYKKYGPQGLAVVGVLLDASDRTGLKDAKALIEQTGVTYPSVIPVNSFLRQINSQYIPVTVFVDETGNQIGEVIVGAYPEKYEEIIRQVLGQ